MTTFVDYTCPTCNAEPAQRCNVIGGTHATRVRAANTVTAPHIDKHRGREYVTPSMIRKEDNAKHGNHENPIT